MDSTRALPSALLHAVQVAQAFAAEAGRAVGADLVGIEQQQVYCRFSASLNMPSNSAVDR
jgi:hypothetical protein